MYQNTETGDQNMDVEVEDEKQNKFTILTTGEGDNKNIILSFSITCNGRGTV